jgi:hypothetical protein
MPRARRIIMTLVLAAMASPADAQVPALSAGSILIGGQATFNIRDIDADVGKLTSLSLAPTAQFFVSNGLALGGEVRLGYSFVGDFDSWSFGLGPAVTYYFVRQGTIHPFCEAALVTLASASMMVTTPEASSARAARPVCCSCSRMPWASTPACITIMRGRSGAVDFDQTNYGLAIGVSAFVF